MSFKQDSGADHVETRPKTYKTLVSTVFSGALLVILFAAFPPAYLEAFWPFSTTRAADDLSGTPLHDYSMSLLEAAQNPDPNPDKGEPELSMSSGSALVANTGPEGTVAPSTESTQKTGQISLHVVREGESLSVIASLYGVSINTILWANDIKDASTIQPGDSLLILPVSGVRYTVKSGGTAADVAKLFDADAEEVALFNGVGANEQLPAGTELIVPGGNLATKETPKKSSGGSSSSSTATTKRAASSVSLGDFANPVPGAYVSQGVHGYNGIDLAGIPSGTPVYAALGGTVIVAKGGGGYNGGYGNYVVISHSNGTQTLYAHLSSLNVSQGQTVSKGEHIGGVGNTGRSTGNHLHFEVRGAVNPFAH